MKNMTVVPSPYPMSFMEMFAIRANIQPQDCRIPTLSNVFHNLAQPWSSTWAPSHYQPTLSFQGGNTHFYTTLREPEGTSFISTQMVNIKFINKNIKKRISLMVPLRWRVSQYNSFLPQASYVLNSRLLHFSKFRLA